MSHGPKIPLLIFASTVLVSCGTEPAAVAINLHLSSALRAEVTEIVLMAFGSQATCQGILANPSAHWAMPECEVETRDSGDCHIESVVVVVSELDEVETPTLLVPVGVRRFFGLGTDAFDTLLATDCTSAKVTEGDVVEITLTLDRIL